MSASKSDFFVGYGKVPASLRGFLSSVAALLILGSAACAALLSLTQGDAGPGGFQWDAGAQTITGMFESKPYPLIHAEPTQAFPQGHTYLLAGDGKRGAQDFGIGLDGQRVKASGIVIKRGALDMMLIGDQTALRQEPVANGRDQAASVKPVDLGRWRMRGEICDGKCYAGAMRPGTGLAHKACANICLIGGIPPVLVTNAPAEGQTFFLIGDLAGNALSPAILDHVAVLIEAEGRLERRGDIAVFKLDPATLKVR